MANVNLPSVLDAVSTCSSLRLAGPGMPLRTVLYLWHAVVCVRKRCVVLAISLEFSDQMHHIYKG